MAVKDGIPIISIFYRYHEFEIQGLNHLDYTKCLLSRNAPRGVHLSQGEVNWLFVRATYSQGDSKCRFLLQQRLCPLVMDFWEKYTEPGKFLSRKSQEAKTSIRALPRDKHNQHKGSIVLTDGIAKIVVPDIDLLSLQNISYLDVVWKVHQASSGDLIPEATMCRIWEGIVINIFHFETESMKVAKLAEAKSEDVKKYWRTVSDHRLALRRQRVRPVAADYFDDYPSPASKQDNRAPSTIGKQCLRTDEADTTMTDVEEVLASEKQQCGDVSHETQRFLSQLFVFGGPPRYADDGTAYNSSPPPGLNHLFRETFAPVTTFSEAHGIIPNVPNSSQRCSNQCCGSPQTANEHSESAFHGSVSRDMVETQARFGEMVLINQTEPAEADDFQAQSLRYGIFSPDPHQVAPPFNNPLTAQPLLPSILHMRQYLALQPQMPPAAHERNTPTQDQSTNRAIRQRMHNPQTAEEYAWFQLRFSKHGKKMA